MKHKIYLLILPLFLTVLGIGLILLTSRSTTNLTQKIELHSKASTNNNPYLYYNNLENWRKNYRDILTYLRYAWQIQSFSGTTYLAEFDYFNPENPKEIKVWAGHMGSIWSPPFYMKDSYDQMNKPNRYSDGFFTSLAFYKPGNSLFRYEKESLLTDSFWYPHKMVNTVIYDDLGIKLTGVKIPIPGKNAATLKLTVQNITSQPLTLNIYLLAVLNSLKNTNNPNYWHWTQFRTPNDDNYGRTEASKNTRYALIFNNSSKNAYAGVGVSDTKDMISWETADNYYDSIYYFRDHQGKLRNQLTDINAADRGTSISYVWRVDNLAPQATTTNSLIVTLDDTAEGAEEELNYLKRNDAEILADNRMKDLLRQTLNNLPVFESSETDLQNFYYSVLTNYFMNYWIKLGRFNQPYMSIVGPTGESVDYFTWSLHYNQISLPFIDPLGQKSMIERNLLVNYKKNLAVSPFQPEEGRAADSNYIHSYPALFYALLEYTLIGADTSFFDQVLPGRVFQDTVQSKTVYQWLVAITDHLNSYGLPDIKNRYVGTCAKKQINANYVPDPERNILFGCLPDSSWDGLICAGNDRQQLEFGIYCDDNQPQAHGSDSYVYKTPDINAFLYDMYLQLYKIEKWRNLPAAASNHFNKAQTIKAAINSKLWQPNWTWANGDKGWFCAIKPNNQPGCVSTHSIFHLLAIDDLLNADQKSRLMAQYPQYVGSGGNYSLRKTKEDPQWKDGRGDWAGPGLYTGEAGFIIHDLLYGGYQQEGYDLLSKYATTLKHAPYISQAVIAEPDAGESFPRTPLGAGGGVANVGMLDSTVFIQSFIHDLMGIDPMVSEIAIRPNIPAAVRQQSGKYFSLKNIKAQHNLFNVTYTPNGSLIDMTVAAVSNPADRAALRIIDQGQYVLNFSHLVANRAFSCKIYNGNGIRIFSQNQTSNNQGRLSFAINLQTKDNYLIEIE